MCCKRTDSPHFAQVVFLAKQPQEREMMLSGKRQFFVADNPGDQNRPICSPTHFMPKLMHNVFLGKK
jgi:hypothetical protein